MYYLTLRVKHFWYSESCPGSKAVEYQSMMQLLMSNIDKWFWYVILNIHRVYQIDIIRDVSEKNISFLNLITWPISCLNYPKM